jgi:hypothetical protein
MKKIVRPALREEAAFVCDLTRALGNRHLSPGAWASKTAAKL